MKNTLPPLYPHTKSKNETLSLIHGIYAGLLISASVVVAYLEMQQSTMLLLYLLMLFAVMAVLICLNIAACILVKKGQNRGLILSRVMAVLMLLNFPIGTLLGAAALWKSLKSQWEV